MLERLIMFGLLVLIGRAALRGKNAGDKKGEGGEATGEGQQQGSADPVAADPVAADPIAADPVAADPVAADPVAADKVKGLVFHMPFDEITGDKVADVTETPLQGMVTGNPQIVDDSKFGKCLRLDGSDDSVAVPHHEKTYVTTYSVSVWIKPNGAPVDWTGIVGKPGRNYNIWIHAQGFVHHAFHDAGTGNAGIPNTPDGSLTWDQWNHVVIVNTGKTAKTYVNGVQKTQGAVSGDLVLHDTDLIIGRDLDGALSHYFKGDIAHLRIYNRSLPPSEVQTVMDGERTVDG